MWTKQRLIEQAFAELALGVGFDIGPDERLTALSRLDSMMAGWTSLGINIGYALPSSTTASSLGADSGLLDTDAEAVFLNLAIRLAPGHGKTVSQDTRTAAKQTYDTLLGAATAPTAQDATPSLLGAGNKPWRRW